MADQNWTDRDAAILNEELHRLLMHLEDRGFHLANQDDGTESKLTMTPYQRMDSTFVWHLNLWVTRD